MRDAIHQFREAMRAAGVEPPEVIEPGRLHRFSTNGRASDDAGWCRLFADQVGGVFGDFRTGLSEVWEADRKPAFTAAEKKAFLRRCDAERRDREAGQSGRHADAAKRAAAILKRACGDPATHDYAIKKAVSLGPLVKRGAWAQRGWDDALLVPIYGPDAAVWSLEAIDANGTKDYLKNGRKRGGFHPFGKIRHADCVLIGEGLATVAAAVDATGFAAVAAMDSGNLEHAARTVRELAPDAELIFLADNDIKEDGSNPGLTAASAAAQAIGGRVIVPELDQRPCDFWNVWHEHGAVAVKSAIDSAAPSDRAETEQSDAAVIDWRSSVQRLAKLPPIDYERVREREAEALACRVSVLDEEVRRARGDAKDTGAGQALSFPEVEPWPDPVCGADVLDEMAALCTRFLHLPKNGGTVVALWVALTYVIDSFDCLPLLFITAPEKGCGKSTVLDLVGRVCNRPLPASNITGAALFRTVEIAKPTLLLDEADSFLRDNEEMRGIINSGHTRSHAFVIRVVGDNHEPRKFSTWCAKAIAGIGRLPGTIEDRAVILSMQRLAPGEQVEKLRHAHQFPDLRRRLARWAGDHRASLHTSRPNMPDALHNRAEDNWEPLFAIADAAGGTWSERATAAVQWFTGTQCTADSIGTELLRDIRSTFESERCDRLSTARLIERLVADDAARWAEYDRGRPVSGPQIAKLLKRYSITPGTIRIRDGSDGTAKGYKLEQFADAFDRYLPALGQKPSFRAVTPSQANNGMVSGDFSSRHTGACVTAAETAETRANAALLPCDGSSPRISSQDTVSVRWRVEL